MKQFFIQLNVAIFLLSVFSFRCLGADKYTLELNLEKGKTYKQRSISDGKMSLNAMGQDIEMGSKTETFVHFNVIERNDDVYDIQMTYQKMKMSMDGMMSFSIDSDSPDGSSAKALQSFIGVPIDIQLTKGGKVIAVKDADQIAKKINGVSDEQVKQMISQQLSESAIQATFNRTAFLPAKPVAVGDKWDATLNVNSNGVDIISKLDLTLKQVKDDIATIDFTGTLATPEGGAVMQIQGMEADVTVKGTQTGTVRLDLKTGWIISSEAIQKSTQEIVVMGNALDMQMEVKATVTAE